MPYAPSGGRLIRCEEGQSQLYSIFAYFVYSAVIRGFGYAVLGFRNSAFLRLSDFGFRIFPNVSP
jgi:hypothetical protein